MNKINDLVSKLSEFIPEFSTYWSSDECTHNFGNESSIHGVFSDFTDSFVIALQANKNINLKSIFEYIENTIQSGGDEADAACTCFLENLVNGHSELFEQGTITPFIGDHSKKFIRTWDEFTGVKTHGI